MNKRYTIWAPTVAVLMTLTAGMAFAKPPQDKQDAIRPLKEAWSPLVPDDNGLRQRMQMSEFQRYELQNREVRKLKEAVAEQMYSVRLNAIAIREPQAHPQYPRGLVLLQGQYVDKEYRALFGKDVTIGIWVKDHEVVRNLNIGDEFDFQGEVIYVVDHNEKDVDRVEHTWRDGDLKTTVVYLKTPLTGFKRDLHIYLVNGRVVPIDDE